MDNISKEEKDDGIRESCSLQEESMDLWHNRLAHTHIPTIRKMQEISPVNSISSTRIRNGKTCEQCITGKITTNILRSRTNSSIIPGEVIHTDICSMNLTPIGGSYILSRLRKRALAT